MIFSFRDALRDDARARLFASSQVHGDGRLGVLELRDGLRQLKLAAALQFGLLGSLAAVWSAFKKDARLLIPYAAWLSYATILNLAICRLNPSGVQTVEDRTPTGVAALY